MVKYSWGKFCADGPVHPVKDVVTAKSRNFAFFLSRRQAKTKSIAESSTSWIFLTSPPAKHFGRSSLKSLLSKPDKHDGDNHKRKADELAKTKQEPVHEDRETVTRITFLETELTETRHKLARVEIELVDAKQKLEDDSKPFFWAEIVRVQGLVPYPLQKLSAEIMAGFAMGRKPLKVTDCSSGVYCLTGYSGKRLAVFKPQCQGSVPKGIHLRCEDLPAREVAAFKVGWWAGVPRTAFAVVRHPVLGSRMVQGVLQTWVDGETLQALLYKNEVTLADFAVDDVHFILVLDYLLKNMDRHAGNLMVASRRLVPIDHSLSLCHTDAEIDPPRLDWPQLDAPLSSTLQAHLEELRIEDEALLDLGIGSQAIHEMAVRLQSLRDAVLFSRTARELFDMLPH